MADQLRDLDPDLAARIDRDIASELAYLRSPEGRKQSRIFWDTFGPTVKKRAAPKRTAVPPVLAAEILASAPERCPLCAALFVCEPSHLKQPTLDHIHPVARGGGHERANLRVICRQCNSRKHAMPDDEFLRRWGSRLKQEAARIGG